MRLGLLRLLLPALFCAVSCPARATGAPDTVTAAIHHAFRPLLTQYDVPGLAVAVTMRGRHHIVCYGVTVRDHRSAVTQDTLFELGSLSKIFTATLATDAVARGAMTLDDHPSAYVPALRGTPLDAATLRALGTYTAGGLPQQVPDGISNNTDMLDWLQHFQPTAAPGATRLYSNISIGLLGLSTARALHTEFAAAMQRDIFTPLGLHHTFIHIPAREINRYAWGYAGDRRVRVNPGPFDAEAYGVKSSAADMVRFLDANLHPDSLPPILRDAIAATHIGYVQSGALTQGLGWEQYPANVGLDVLLQGNSADMASAPHDAVPADAGAARARTRLFNKTGSTNGFSAYAVFVPDRQIGLVMLANRNVPIEARIRAAYAVLSEIGGTGGRSSTVRP